MTVASGPYSLGGCEYNSKAQAAFHARQLLQKYAVGDVITLETEVSFFFDWIWHYPRVLAITGLTIQKFVVTSASTIAKGISAVLPDGRAIFVSLSAKADWGVLPDGAKEFGIHTIEDARRWLSSSTEKQCDSAVDAVPENETSQSNPPDSRDLIASGGSSSQLCLDTEVIDESQSLKPYVHSDYDLFDVVKYILYQSQTDELRYNTEKYQIDYIKSLGGDVTLFPNLRATHAKMDIVADYFEYLQNKSDEEWLRVIVADGLLMYEDENRIADESIHYSEVEETRLRCAWEAEQQRQQHHEDFALEVVLIGDEHRIDSRLIARALGIEHGPFMTNTVRKYQEHLVSLGQLHFENGVGYRPQGGGNPERYVMLNDAQASLVVMQSRTTDRSLPLKIKLSLTFKQARENLERLQEELRQERLRREHGERPYTWTKKIGEVTKLNEVNRVSYMITVAEYIYPLLVNLGLGNIVVNERANILQSFSGLFARWLRGDRSGVLMTCPLSPTLTWNCADPFIEDSSKWNKEQINRKGTRVHPECATKYDTYYYPVVYSTDMYVFWFEWYLPNYSDSIYLKGKLPGGAPRVTCTDLEGLA